MAPQAKGRKKALVTRAAPVIDPADRLSQLPREIQAHILSLLPVQEAVRTCVLARTWRDGEVWKLTRRLLITGRERVSVQEVRGFVDRLLRVRLDGLDDDGYAPIDTSEIVFDNWGDLETKDGRDDDTIEIICAAAIKRWMRRVLKCKVQSLRVDMLRSGDLGFDKSYMDMHSMSLVSRHLTKLELRGMTFLGGCGCLNFSGCPALGHLEFTYCELSDLTKVTSPSVKRLVMTGCTSSAGSERLQICFPGLVSLCLQEFFGSSPMLESMPQLRKAYVSTDTDYSIDYDDYGKCVVLQGLAEAKHLVLLSSEDKTNIFRRDLRWCPTFSKLMTLVLNDYWCKSADCSELACMLQHAPVLEKLTVLFSREVELKYDVVVEGRPNASGKSTMISRLKIVKVKCSEIHQRVLNVLNFLGTHNIWFQFRVTQGSK